MDDRISIRIQNLINGQKEESRRQLFEGINRIKSELAQHNALHSSTTAQQIYKLCARELEIRATQIWQSIVRVHQTYGTPNPESLSNELKDLFKQYISTEAKELTDVMIQNLMDRSFAMFCHLDTEVRAVLEKHNAEIDLYVDSLKYSPEERHLMNSDPGQKDVFVLNKDTRMKKTTQIFLCHASEDKDKVLEIYRRLKDLGFKPWIDKEDLLPGQKWEIEIPKAIKESDHVLVFFSNTSISKRGYVQKEFELALDVLDLIPEGQIFIVPIRLDNCEIPDRFKHLQYCDLFEDNGFDKVLKAIKKQSFPLIPDIPKNIEQANGTNSTNSNLADVNLAPDVATSLSRSILTRLEFLGDIDENSNADELQKKVDDLVKFIEQLPQGSYFSQRIKELTRRLRVGIWFSGKYEDAERKEMEERNQRYRKQLINARSEIRSIIDELIQLH